jgi:HEAT repeat protein
MKPELKTSAIFALGKIKSERAIQTLEYILRTDEKWQNRECAASALAYISTPDTLAILASFVEDEREEIRNIAFDAVNNQQATE